MIENIELPKAPDEFSAEELKGVIKSLAKLCRAKFTPFGFFTKGSSAERIRIAEAEFRGEMIRFVTQYQPDDLAEKLESIN